LELDPEALTHAQAWHENPPMNRRRNVPGFTLIELMVTLVVAAVLIAIAVPSYSLMLRKSRRTDAKSALLDLAGLEERYFSTAYNYTTAPGQLGYSGTWSATSGITVGSGYYQILQPAVVAATPAGTAANGSVTAATPATFSVSAIAVPGTDQANDTDCARFTVTSSGARTAVNSANVDNSAVCWQ